MTFGQVASNGTEYLVVMLAAYYAFAILGMVRASVRACIRVPSFSVLCSPMASVCFAPCAFVRAHAVRKNPLLIEPCLRSSNPLYPHARTHSRTSSVDS